MPGLSSRRLLRPHIDWQLIDFGLALAGLAFLAAAVWGVGIIYSAARDSAILDRECARGACAHQGTLTAHERVYFRGSRWVSSRTDYCMLTMSLDDATSRQAIVNGPNCNILGDGAPIGATIWRGEVVIVQSGPTRLNTFLHPASGIVAGYAYLLALIPFLLCVAMIHLDLIHHNAVIGIGRRFSRRTAQPVAPVVPPHPVHPYRDAAHHQPTHPDGRP